MVLLHKILYSLLVLLPLPFRHYDRLLMHGLYCKVHYLKLLCIDEHSLCRRLIVTPLLYGLLCWALCYRLAVSDLDPCHLCIFLVFERSTKSCLERCQIVGAYCRAIDTGFWGCEYCINQAIVGVEVSN